MHGELKSILWWTNSYPALRKTNIVGGIHIIYGIKNECLSEQIDDRRSLIKYFIYNLHDHNIKSFYFTQLNRDHDSAQQR